MIGQVYELGTGFKGEALYLLYGHLDNLNPDRVDWIETRNLPTDDPLAAARIMAATARDRRTKQKPVYHFSISFDYNDPADRALMLRVADRLLADLKMQGYQALMVAHRDRAHAHLHIVVNRIHPEELTIWSNWNDYRRIERSLRAQEAELGLRVVPGFLAPVFDEDGKRLKPAQLVRGDAGFLERVRAEAGPYLASADSWAELERGLANHGLRVRMKGRGMVVTDGKHEVKASEIDRTFSRSRLEKELGIHGEYRLRQQIAARTLDERAARVEKAVVADASAERSTPAERTPEETRIAASEPDHGPVSAFLPQPARLEEGGTYDPVVQTVAADRVDAEVRVPAETLKDSRMVAAADVPREGRRLTPEPVNPPERHRDEADDAPDREEVTTDEPAPLPIRNESADAEAFLQMVDRFRQREAVWDEVRKLDEIRENIEKWSSGFERVNTDVKAATNHFAKEIRAAFRDPKAFSDVFEQLTEEQKRATLKNLGKRPAEFAREFLAAHGHMLVHIRAQPRGWRATVANAAQRLRGTTPEQHVFRNPSDARAGVLTAAAGERYVDAVRVRGSARRAIARNLGLSEEVTLAEVREALSVRMAAANAQKAEAISRRESLSAPTARELERAFSKLSFEDQRRVIKRVPDLMHYIPNAFRLAQGFAEGPQQARGGISP